MLEIFFTSDAVYLGVDLHGQEKPEAGMRMHGVELLFQLHQPSGGQVDVLQHHPSVGPRQSGYQNNKTRRTCSENTQKTKKTKKTKNTHLPDLTAVLMSLSALLKPSAEPVDSVRTKTFTNYNLTELLLKRSYLCVKTMSLFIPYR